MRSNRPFEPYFAWLSHEYAQSVECGLSPAVKISIGMLVRESPYYRGARATCAACETACARTRGGSGLVFFAVLVICTGTSLPVPIYYLLSCCKFSIGPPAARPGGTGSRQPLSGASGKLYSPRFFGQATYARGRTRAMGAPPYNKLRG